MQHITIKLTNEQMAVVDGVSARTGWNREEVARLAVDNLGLLGDEDLEIMAGIARGRRDFAEGRIATDEQVAAVFRKFGAID